MSATKQTILVVDDEPSVRLLLRRAFEAESYQVLDAENRQQTLDAVEQYPVSLVTLDINLAGEDGLAVAQAIRAVSSVPIIMVTGKGDLIDTVVGLEMGADDYIAKPFQIREVLARIKSALRRGQLNDNPDPQPAETHSDTQPQFYHFANCTLSTHTRDLSDPDGIVCELTTAEFNLLEVFVRHALHALSRDQIMDKIKGSDWNPNDRTIDNTVAKLRKKLAALGVHKAIKTVRGVGYQFAIEVQILRRKPS